MFELTVHYKHEMIGIWQRFHRNFEQKCIPVGCIPPAHWPCLRILSYPMHTSLEQPCMPPRATTPPGSNHAHPPEQPCMPPESNHACPPGATMHTPWEQPCIPPGATMHAHLGATMHTPREQPHSPPGATMHAPQATMHAPRVTMHAPQGNHACPPRATTYAPQSNHACPPCGQNVDTRFWKYYLAPTSLRAVIKWNFELTVPDLYTICFAVN